MQRTLLSPRWPSPKQWTNSLWIEPFDPEDRVITRNTRRVFPLLLHLLADAEVALKTNEQPESRVNHLVTNLNDAHLELLQDEIADTVAFADSAEAFNTWFIEHFHIDPDLTARYPTPGVWLNALDDRVCGESFFRTFHFWPDRFR